MGGSVVSDRPIRSLEELGRIIAEEVGPFDARFEDLEAFVLRVIAAYDFWRLRTISVNHTALLSR